MSSLILTEACLTCDLRFRSLHPSSVGIGRELELERGRLVSLGWRTSSWTLVVCYQDLILYRA